MSWGCYLSPVDCSEKLLALPVPEVRTSFRGLVAVHVYLRVSTDLGARCGTWPEVSLSLLFLLPFGEVFEVFCWRG